MTGPVQRLLRRLSRPSSEREREELQATSAQAGSVPADQLIDRQLCQCTGTVRSLSLRPRAGEAPALVVDLDDGHRTLTVIWLGRRRIAGIHPGVMLTVRGRVSLRKGSPTMFNPSYEINPPKTAE
ncbi:OB-fold nucleic acid binding domain-containing protein [Calidifontibacter sp. DB0510]|uniref:OB-fold nucleic acid binding domain-containing protein n=1 Tax=Metallococcus carri TaxID=1656884 RepID=A0A967EBF9_9MICO|nr:OB-fold nucleic acid binding domain-containing protein [Metallococcus carri]NHN56899.1 OB-fold nucleic acid binding domain-containing protein [Metallococcus carri]NOP37644.1 OB-fold nucleic acid binding domain-containing protein [Calidifontibacter sp. DB2511S]